MAVLGGPVRPVLAQGGPPALRLPGVQRRVLHDDRGQSFGVPQREPESDRRAEVHHVDRELVDSELLEQAVDHVGQVVEGVAERGPVRHRAVAERGIVRGDDAVGVREPGDQVAEHARGGGEAVQQEHDGPLSGPASR